MAILPNSSEFVRATPLGWQQHMKQAIRCPETLAGRLELPVEAICPRQSTGTFPLFVPLPYLSRIKKRDLQDPLLRQVLPIEVESQPAVGFAADPLNESHFMLSGGLLKKYAGRALLICNGTCAIHCRYCFRRHFPYESDSHVTKQWQGALNHIRRDPSIHEVILSGGDPLTLVDVSLEKLVAAIEAIPHVRRLRIHSRLPVVIPQRITNKLVQRLGASRLICVLVIHANHANELDEEVAQAVGLVKAHHTNVMNQSVLLQGVNDSVDELSRLSERLVEIGALPYYLHQLDPVKGTAHFQVPEKRGVELISRLREMVPGYLVPRYVRETPGELSKTVLA